MDTGVVQTQSHAGQTAPTKDNAEIEPDICCHTVKDILLTKENHRLATVEGEGKIPELLNKIFQQIIKKHPSLSLIDLIAAIQKAKPVNVAASAIKKPLKKIASQEGNKSLHDMLDKMVEELVTKHPSIAVIELVSSLQNAKPVHVAASKLKKPLKKIASQERDRYLHDMLDKMVEHIVTKHPSIVVVELVSSLQKAKPVPTAASGLKEHLKKISSEEGSRQLHEMLDKMVEEFVTKHPSIAVIEVITSLQKSKPVHAAGSAVRGLIKKTT